MPRLPILHTDTSPQLECYLKHEVDEVLHRIKSIIINTSSNEFVTSLYITNLINENFGDLNGFKQTTEKSV